MEHKFMIMKKSIILIFAFLLTSVVAFSQETIRYVCTKYFDGDGVEYKAKPNDVIKLQFHGNSRIGQYQGWGTAWWKYHHSENGNRVYYSVGTDIVTGQEVMDENSKTIIVVSGDRSYMNRIDRWDPNNTRVYVYERRDADVIGPMRR